MAFKTVLDSLDAVDEPLRAHYKEVVDPKDATKKTYVIDLDGDVAPIPQFKSVRDEAAQNRIKVRDLTAKYSKFDVFKDMDPADVLAKLDRIAELEAAKGGKLNEQELEAAVEGRIKTKLAPLERESAKLKSDLAERDAKISEYEKANRTRTMTDAVREAALKLKIRPEALEDAIAAAERVMDVGDDNAVSVKATGDNVEAWLRDMMGKRPHWWPESASGNARGGAGGGGAHTGPNPWKADTWNMTQQNQVYLRDPKLAEQLAKQAGTKVGGLRPVSAKA